MKLIETSFNFQLRSIVTGHLSPVQVAVFQNVYAQEGLLY